MLKTNKTIIVEGKYDKIKLSSIIEGNILVCGGFSLFHDEEKIALIRRLAEKDGIVVMTDSDAAGFKIRSFLGGIIPKEQITNIYIPDVYGKEKRKSSPGKEGKLGVEGIDTGVLKSLLESVNTDFSPSDPVTFTDLYMLGVSGKPESATRRRLLLTALGLPSRLGVGGMRNAVNAVYTREEFLSVAERILNEEVKETN